LPDKIIRDIVNLLLHGGAFIGLCASSMAALTFELTGSVENNLSYILLIGVATAALYCAHRVIGLHKLAHITASERYEVIRKYKVHIWLYALGWVLFSIWIFIPMANFNFIMWLAPGGIIAIAYVLPFLSRGRRLRDTGWIKILLIGWSWAWLTAFMPAYYFSETPLYLSVIIGVERMLFIVAITIPFEIRDLNVDRSIGLLTMPSIFGMKRTLRMGKIMCYGVILLAFFLAFHFINPAYAIAMVVTSLLTIQILNKSTDMTDDYFFSGLTDGLMIIALLVYSVINILI
jgi:4-hydroxybenzoate polyprenyltransferase